MNTNGIYTEKQSEEMIMLIQRGNSVQQVISHHTTAMQENSGTFINQFTGIGSMLEPALTQAGVSGIYVAMALQCNDIYTNVD